MTPFTILDFVLFDGAQARQWPLIDLALAEAAARSARHYGPGQDRTDPNFGQHTNFKQNTGMSLRGAHTAGPFLRRLWRGSRACVID